MKATGNTIFITGGGSGIGRGLAEAFHKLGNKVVIAGRRRDVLAATAAANPGMEFIPLDTTDCAAIRSVAAEVTSRFPELNVIVNNAGVQRVHDFSSDQPVDEDAIAQEIETNIVGVIHVISSFLPHLKSKPAATILNISSGLAFIPKSRYPVYCATKAFVHSFTMSLRRQLRNTSVRVIELAPPWVVTDLHALHGNPTVPSGAGPMPLADFIEAAMRELASSRDELPVAGAKFLYAAGVSERASATFDELNP